MLTLTRKAGESIRIGDEISIIIKEIKGRQVRIGIVAPRNIYVCREELYLKIQEENLAAHQSLKEMGTVNDAGVIQDPFTAFGSLFRQKMGYDSLAQDDVCLSDVTAEISVTAPSTSGSEASKLNKAPSAEDAQDVQTQEVVEDEG